MKPLVTRPEPLPRPSPTSSHDESERRSRSCLSNVSTRETYVDGLMASTFFALNGLVGCGHMSGLVARRICPLALMKSDDQNPYQICELQAHVSQQVVFGLRWRPCRSSRFNALAKLQTVICATAPWICLQEGRRPYAFANISARKISPVLIIAQMIRASLLASATVTRRAGFFARSALIQSASAPLRLLTLRSSEVAERTSSFLM